MVKKIVLYGTIFITVILVFSLTSYGITKVDLQNDTCKITTPFYLSEKYFDNLKPVNIINSLNNIYVRQLWNRTGSGNFVFSSKINKRSLDYLVEEQCLIIGYSGIPGMGVQRIQVEHLPCLAQLLLTRIQ